MSKSILVIDTPDSCDKCPLFHGYYTDMACGDNNYGINYPYPKDFRQNWCPLKELPKQREIFNHCDDYLNGIDDGWNNCIDEILGND